MAAFMDAPQGFCSPLGPPWSITNCKQRRGAQSYPVGATSRAEVDRQFTRRTVGVSLRRPPARLVVRALDGGADVVDADRAVVEGAVLRPRAGVGGEDVGGEDHLLGVPVAEVLEEEEVKSFLESIQLPNHELPYSDRNLVLSVVLAHMDQILGGDSIALKKGPKKGPKKGRKVLLL